MFKKGEKGADGGAAAILVLIILLIFVFYIVLIPPADRAELLGDNDPSQGDGSGIVAPGNSNALLQESIGNLGFVQSRSVDHLIPNMNLFERRSAQVIENVAPFDVSTGIFSMTSKVVEFSIKPEMLDNVLLSFQVPERSGSLRITLNGEIIYDQEVLSRTPSPIPIKKNLLRDNNVLRFEADGGFWIDKYYSLKDVKVIADIIDSEAKKAENTFILSDEEFNNIDQGSVSFYVQCDQASVGQLRVDLNGNSIYKQTPSCDSPIQSDVLKGDFVKERNRLNFEIEKGGVFIDTAQIKTSLKPSKGYTGYFQIDDGLLADVKKGNREITLTIMFVDDSAQKEAELNVNGIVSGIDQNDDVFTKDLSAFVREGNNYVQIDPLTDLRIVELIVDYK
jgi:hypothetical protein